MFYKNKNNTSKRRSKPNLVKKLDKVFSLYIRLRDANSQGYFRCISCGKIKPFEKADCGHFFSRTHMSVRWDEDNCHAECSYCNRFRSDHIVDYRQNLIRKIGQQRYNMLSIRAREPRKWSDFELKLLIEKYKRLTDILSNEKRIK